MAISQKRSRRKRSSGKYSMKRKQKQYELGGTPVLTTIGAVRRRLVRILGGNEKRKMLKSDVANVFDPKTKKTVRAKVSSVLDNSANRFYPRRNIMTKGAIIETDKGKAKITSRPGQDGVINAVLQ